MIPLAARYAGSVRSSDRFVKSWVAGNAFVPPTLSLICSESARFASYLTQFVRIFSGLAIGAVAYSGFCVKFS